MIGPVCLATFCSLWIEEGPVAFRFVHTADLHLDSPLRSLAMRDADLAGRVELATRKAFSSIVQHCLDERVDALMIAGDLTDGAQSSVKTAVFLTRELARLSEAGIRTFIIRGNHDARAPLTKGLEWPELVHVFDGRGASVVACEGDRPVVVHGVSFAKEKAPDSLLPRYARPGETSIDIGLMHTSLGGDGAHDTYAPCALTDLVAHGYAYWGLGHVHSRAVHHSAGDGAVVMAGMPQGRDMGETGAKSASLVTIRDDGTVDLDEVATSAVEFARCSVTLRPEMGWKEAVEVSIDALMEASGRTAASDLVARIRLEGASHEAWRLRRDADYFLEDLNDGLPAGSGVTIEKVEPAMAATETGAVVASTGPLIELQRAMREAVDDPEFLVWAREHAEKLARTAFKGLRGSHDAILGENEEAAAALLARFVSEGADEIGARLEGATREADGGATEGPRSGGAVFS